jgi:DNA-binding HxlR family transcriptional regulator
LREGERNVGELAQLCGYTAANISRHLSLMTQQGLVRRESRGTSVYYSIADESVYALCDLVCGSIARQYERATKTQHAIFRGNEGQRGWIIRPGDDGIPEPPCFKHLTYIHRI